MFDEDIKIASPDNLKFAGKRTEKTVSVHEEYDRESAKGNTVKAKSAGVLLAKTLVDNIDSFAVGLDDSGNNEMSVQKGILMAFAATVSIEEGISSSVVLQTAKNSFNTELERLLPQLYKAIGDSGAFSFYYLAYRRGAEVERRVGQTFAMLCSHDGDPVYQELGEAVYCWFISLCEKTIRECEIL